MKPNSDSRLKTVRAAQAARQKMRNERRAASAQACRWLEDAIEQLRPIVDGPRPRLKREQFEREFPFALWADGDRCVVLNRHYGHRGQDKAAARGAPDAALVLDVTWRLLYDWRCRPWESAANLRRYFARLLVALHDLNYGDLVVDGRPMAEGDQQRDLQRGEERHV